MVSVATFGAEVLGVSREVWFLLQSYRLPSLLPLGVLVYVCSSFRSGNKPPLHSKKTTVIPEPLRARKGASQTVCASGEEEEDSFPKCSLCVLY